LGDYFGSDASASSKARLKSRFQKALNLGKRLLKGFLPLKDGKIYLFKKLSFIFVSIAHLLDRF